MSAVQGVRIAPMGAEHAEQVLAIHQLGIDEGNATFETAAPIQAPIHDQFDALDTTWSSWMRDIKLARARLIVPTGYLRSNGPGEEASFDLDREIW